MKKTERLVYYYDLSIHAESRTFKAPKPIYVKKAFQLMELVPMEKRLKEASKGREQFYISDWKWEGDIISILVNKSDKGISDPVFTIPQKKQRRTAEKQEEEGQDFSVHIVVQLPQDDQQAALVLIENCVGLGVYAVQRLLNQILHDAKQLKPLDYEQFHPDGAVDDKGKSKKYNVDFKCEFEGHISDDLKYDLDNGKIQSIELITEKEKYTNIDEDGYIQEKCKTLVLTLKDEGVKGKFNKIKNVFIKKKDDYSRARIKFKTPTGVDRTVVMDTNDVSAQGYVKKEKLDDFEFDLKSSYDKFCDALLERMKDLLRSRE
ncbi:hypothetical protein [Nitrosomonas ureae]|uniref:Uncharacterized protein n=1 Tax=Nitrosomonas ureae TaxID=44577 RepID=A0A1H2DMA5_9PROT|nr:hypothetical protein [Nitrosomonas ureae]ALQ50650.1 hypothetical protein ATY38_05030 [Nitrosomonas ureae]SDT84030.1 hypothetical protein SAMN05216406_10195 [Nitrosomonas ureae]